jgi:deoxyadenosine/deoxycytidine kinase
MATMIALWGSVVNKYNQFGGFMAKKYMLINVENEGSIILDSSIYADFNSFLDECFNHLNVNDISFTYTYMDDAELLAYKEKECIVE